ncbi:MAG: asparaginase [Methanobacteriota archaeon]|nr:MAG: asparaginase [Euryarchaeota archaeon]
MRISVENIAIITTGGTIGASQLNRTIGVVPSQSEHLLNLLKRTNNDPYNDISIEIFEAFRKASEDIEPNDWLDLAKKIQDVQELGVNGIIITHGTDSLAYTASALHILSPNWKVPICFTGSFYPPSHPETDALINLEAAIKFVLLYHGTPEVFVAFRSSLSNRSANIFAAVDLIPMSYNDQYFSSLYKKRIAKYSNGTLNFHKKYLIGRPKAPFLESEKIPSDNNISEAKKKVVYLTVYPGMDFNLLYSACKNADIVVFHAFHSGTIPANSSDFMRFLMEASEKKTLLIGTFPSRYLVGTYESTLCAINAGARVYADIQPHVLYVYALVATALGLTPEEITASLRNLEVILEGRK